MHMIFYPVMISWIKWQKLIFWNIFPIFYRLTVEYPPTGGAIPSYKFRTVKLLRYVTAFDYFILACEGIFCLYILYYMVEEILEIKRHRWAYFKSSWNCLDVIIIMVIILDIYIAHISTIHGAQGAQTINSVLLGGQFRRSQHSRNCFLPVPI